MSHPLLEVPQSLFQALITDLAKSGRGVKESGAFLLGNLALRKSLDKVSGAAVLEAGIGDGVDGFARVQAHAFPGCLRARDIWVGEDPKASRAVDISKPAYQSLLKESSDECGTTIVAGRSIATPFVGAFAGALLARLSSSGELQEHAWNFDVNSL